MKGSIRLALSSYLVVVAGCTPSGLPTPEPAFGPIQQGMAFAAPSARRTVRLSRAESAPAETLSVRVRGPALIGAATSAQFTASVGNGSASARHYYWWFIASCAKRSGCVPSSYALLAEGIDDSTVTVRFASTSAEKDIVVQVAEVDGTRRTGSSGEFPVMGPSRRLGGGSDGFAGGVCDWFAGSFYPHTGRYTDPFTGRSWDRRFRRDYCHNRISWNPEG